MLGRKARSSLWTGTTISTSTTGVRVSSGRVCRDVITPTPRPRRRQPCAGPVPDLREFSVLHRDLQELVEAAGQSVDELLKQFLIHAAVSAEQHGGEVLIQLALRLPGGVRLPELLLTALAGTHLAHPGTHLPGTAGRGVGVAQAPRTGGDGHQ